MFLSARFSLSKSLFWCNFELWKQKVVSVTNTFYDVIHPSQRAESSFRKICLEHIWTDDAVFLPAYLFAERWTFLFRHELKKWAFASHAWWPQAIRLIKWTSRTKLTQFEFSIFSKVFGRNSQLDKVCIMQFACNEFEWSDFMRKQNSRQCSEFWMREENFFKKYR